jgi:hypothetical protein
MWQMIQNGSPKVGMGLSGRAPNEAPRQPVVEEAPGRWTTLKQQGVPNVVPSLPRQHESETGRCLWGRGSFR